MSNPYGQIVDTTHSAGLSPRQFYVRVFVWNEKQWPSSWWNCRTDAEIKQLVLLAFPSRAWSKGLVRVAGWRAAYNRGGLTKRKPTSLSHKYLLGLRGTHVIQVRKSRRFRKEVQQLSSERLQVANVLSELLARW